MTASAFQDVQIGLETTWGTPVTPTVLMKLVSECTVTPVEPTRQIPELKATLHPTSVAIRTTTAGRAALRGVASYEQINYLLESLMQKVTPTGAGPYVRAGTFPAATPSGANTRAYTLVKGDTGDGVYKLEGGLVDDLRLSVEYGDDDVELKYDATLLGTKGSSGTLAALSDPASLTPILAPDFAVYVDAAGGTIGTTVVSNTIYGFELALARKSLLSRYLGSRVPAVQTMGKQEREASLRLMCELNATSKAYFDAIIGSAAAVIRQVRLKATSGTSIMQLDFAGYFTALPDFSGDRGGVKALTFEMEPIYNTALANFFAYSNTSGLATL